MKLRLLQLCLTFFLIGSVVLAGPGESFKERQKKIVLLDGEIQKCLQKKDYRGFMDNVSEALRIMPENHNIHYQMARAYALNNKMDEAIRQLTPLIRKGLFLDVESDKDFANVLKIEQFKPLAERIAEWKKPIIRSETAFILPERDLIPEGITYDPVEKAFYLSSLLKCKVVKVDAKGNSLDFVKPRQDGMLPSLGMCIDSKRRHLWVCNGFGYPTPNLDKKYFNCTGVFKYDLDSGKLVKKYSLPQAEAHFFNDVALAPDGAVFLSDSHVAGVYTIDSKKDELEILADLPMAYYPNGIAYSAKTGKIFITSQFEISVIDRKTGKYSKLAHSPDMFISRGDGLYYRNGTLVSIQGGLKPPRIISMVLDEAEERVTGLQVLESNNPEILLPTTGAIVGDWLYFFADAQFRKGDKNGKFLPPEELDPVKVLRVKL